MSANSQIKLKPKTKRQIATHMLIVNIVFIFITILYVWFMFSVQGRAIDLDNLSGWQIFGILFMYFWGFLRYLFCL